MSRIKEKDITAQDSPKKYDDDDGEIIIVGGSI